MDIKSKLFCVGEENYPLLLNEQNKSEKEVEETIQLLLEWYKSQPHFPDDALDYEIMKRYYASAKFDIKNTKSKIDKLFIARRDVPEFFKNRDPLDPTLVRAMDVIHWVMVPKLTPDCHRVFVMRYTEGDYSELDFNNSFKIIFMEADLRMRYDLCLGDVFVWDLTYFSLTHALKVTPMTLKKIFYIIQDCYGARIKAIHIINCPTLAQPLIALIKLLVKKKISDRIFIHSSLEELHKYVPTEYLPPELGGSNLPCKEIIEMYREAMQSEDMRKWYIESESKVIDDSKRPGKSQNQTADDFGTVGSFKKLNID